MSSAAAAEYETAYRLLEASRLVARPVAVSTLPFVVYLISRGDWDEAGRKARQATLVAALLGLGPLAVGLFAPSQAMRLIWGPDYADAGDILRVLMISAPVVFIVLIGTILAISLKRERQLIWVMVCAALFNVAANAVAIPVWGAVAAAWTTLITELGIGLGVLTILGRSEFATLLPRFLRRTPVPGKDTEAG